MSGTEPVLFIDEWKKPTVGNCWSFALNDPLNRPGLQKAQPGDRSGMSHLPLNLSTCEVARRAMMDNPGNMYAVQAEMPCKQGFHKIFVFNAPGAQGDYHFLRQAKDIVMRKPRGKGVKEIAAEFEVGLDQVVPLGRDKVLLKDVGIFVHKLGFATGALYRDSCGKLIRDPRKACKTYGERTYSKPCGSFCARSGVARSRPDHMYRQR